MEPKSEPMREVFSKMKLFQGENPFDLRKAQSGRGHVALVLVLILFVVNITGESYCKYSHIVLIDNLS